MQLGDILDDLTLDVATGSLEITHVDIDSRECVPGSLFFAMPGESTSGAKFAGDAVRRGALCVVANTPLDVTAPVVVVPSTQLTALCAHASAAVVGHPETRTRLVAVTGTNGKTSVTTIVAGLARALSWNGANIGTLTNERTTPAAPELFRTLAALVDGFDPTVPSSVVAMEVSSHAMSQHRVDGLEFTVAAFTNLSHEHLDYHGSMEEYFVVKSRLFTPEHSRRAVIWSDDPYGERLAGTTTLPVTRVSRRDATDVETSLKGTTFFWRGHLVNSALLGDYNVDNALIAMSIMAVLGAEDAAIAAAMGEVSSIAGRFDVVRGSNVTVIVDYAHTPEGLRRLLSDVRAMVPEGRVITVFGCGGDRDRAKRPEMGLVASTFSDLTIVTSDNPRSEEPESIIDAIMSGVMSGANVVRDADRRSAIGRALHEAAPVDVVVVAGKGHETTQTIGDLVVPFDDRVVARELLGASPC
ncbi:MAG: UDP-N-acetylmuramoyl-L-alanyl-D-glutamate--2,6-diaminopimelate ligase [Acidimicrobiales bacterium]|jgi:UDP-N-acetylmuramoyl-L-alanyl-D-glutamate--2,6-diaminopimelate ligase